MKMLVKTVTRLSMGSDTIFQKSDGKTSFRQAVIYRAHAR